MGELHDVIFVMTEEEEVEPEYEVEKILAHAQDAEVRPRIMLVRMATYTTRAPRGIN